MNFFHWLSYVNVLLVLLQVEESPSLSRRGLLRKELPDGPARLYEGMDREVELLDEDYSILLSSLTCSDSGLYLCQLAAPVGEQNKEGRILLSVKGKY